MATKLKKRLNKINYSLMNRYPEGLEIGDYGNKLDTSCSDTKPFRIVKRTKKNTGKKQRRKRRVTKYIGPDGKPINKDLISLYKIQRKEKAKLANISKKLKDPLSGKGSYLENMVALAPSALGSRRNGSNNINDLFFAKGTSIDTETRVSPELPIPAVLETEILVSDKGPSQKVRARILVDIYDKDSGELLIGKNSIAYGQTTTFNKDTGLMNITMDRTWYGNKQIDIQFNVHSANDVAGLHGEVWDTRGKYLLGTFVSAFAQGVLSAISQNYVSPYVQNSHDLISLGYSV